MLCPSPVRGGPRRGSEMHTRPFPLCRSFALRALFDSSGECRKPQVAGRFSAWGGLSPTVSARLASSLSSTAAPRLAAEPSPRLGRECRKPQINCGFTAPGRALRCRKPPLTAPAAVPQVAPLPAASPPAPRFRGSAIAAGEDASRPGRPCPRRAGAPLVSRGVSRPRLTLPPGVRGRAGRTRAPAPAPGPRPSEFQGAALRPRRTASPWCGTAPARAGPGLSLCRRAVRFRINRPPPPC